MTVRHAPEAIFKVPTGIWMSRCTCGQAYQAASLEGAEEALAAHIQSTRSLGREIETGPEQGEQMRFEEGEMSDG